MSKCRQKAGGQPAFTWRLCFDAVLTFVASYWAWIVSGDESDLSLQSHQSAGAGEMTNLKTWMLRLATNEEAERSDRRTPQELKRLLEAEQDGLGLWG
jgi:hypothetical protein